MTYREKCRTVLARRARVDLAAEVMSDELHAVADAEHWDAGAERLRVDLWRAGLVNARRPAREDEPGRLPAAVGAGGCGGGAAGRSAGRAGGGAGRGPGVAGARGRRSAAVPRGWREGGRCGARGGGRGGARTRGRGGAWRRRGSQPSA